MKQQDYQKLKEILSQAYDLKENERLDFINRKCCDEPELTKSILEMLDIAQSPESEALDKPVIKRIIPELDTEPEKNQPALAIGTQINEYCIVGLLGSGGMGHVYCAQQKYPAERKVAIKLLKDSPNQHIINKETQVLARLNHPNIATLFEINKTKGNQLFIVMEWIDGTGIIEWCESHDLTSKAIIELIHQLCAGLSYAHELGVIHCDIKPGNVLVTEINGKAAVKIIDFGISQFKNKQSGGTSGTPTYLAPEILNSKENPISDIRRDVYALGVLMEKLFVGETNRDLLAIIQKAKAQNKQDRYASPFTLNLDLKRFLNKKSVSARDHNFAYLTKLFIQRRYGVVIISLLFALTLIVGFIAQSLQATKATKHAELAKIAQVEAEEISGFLLEMFNTKNPEKGKDSAITIDDLLIKTKQSLLKKTSQTIADARFMYTIGLIYARHDKMQDAKELIEKALMIQTEKLSPDDIDRIDSMAQLGYIYRVQKEFKKSEEYLLKSIELYKENGTEHDLHLSMIHNHLGNLYIANRHYDLAIKQHLSAIEIREKHKESKDLGLSYNNMGVIYNNKRNWKLALHYYNLALLEFLKEYNESHPFISAVKQNIALIEMKNLNWVNAEHLLKEAILIRLKAYGTTHSKTIMSQFNLAILYSSRMQYKKAIEVYKQILAALDNTDDIEAKAKFLSLLARSYGLDKQFEISIKFHQESIELIKNLQLKEKYLHFKIYNKFANTLILTNKFHQALKLLKNSLNYLEQKYANDNYTRLKNLNNIANIYYKLGEYELAENLYSDVLYYLKPDISNNHKQFILAKLGLGITYHKQKKYIESEELLQQALSENQLKYGEKDKTNGLIYYELGKLNLTQNKPLKAKHFLKSAVSSQKLTLPTKHKDLLATISLLKKIN